MRWLLIVFIFANIFITSVAAHDRKSTFFCGFREYQWKDSTRDRAIKAAAWYPADEQSMSIAYGPLKGRARADAPISAGRHPLILISHGTGGSRYNQFYLSEVLAAHGYIVLAVQHPRNCGGNEGDNSDADLLVNLWDRPKDISFALDQALKEPELAKHTDPVRIGIIGHSLGGYTALVLLGAKPDIARLDKFCSSFRGWFSRRFCSSKAEELEAWRKGNFLDFSRGCF